MICQRCGEETNVSSMSYFNTDILCMACKREEKDAPGYQLAVEAEAHQVRHGNTNFSGIGLSAEASSYLAGRRAARPKRR